MRMVGHQPFGHIFVTAPLGKKTAELREQTPWTPEGGGGIVKPCDYTHCLSRSWTPEGGQQGVTIF